MFFRARSVRFLYCGVDASRRACKDQPQIARDCSSIRVHFAGDSGAQVIAGGRFGQPKLIGILSERIGKQEAVVPLAIARSASVVRETLQLQREQEHFEVQVGTPENTSLPTQRKGGVQLLGPPQPLSKSAIRKLWSR